MTIADNWPKTVCRTLEAMISKAKENLLPLVNDPNARANNYISRLFDDTEDDLRVWVGKYTAEAVAMALATERIKCHCRRLKLLERLLWAYRDGNNELKSALRTL